ncbi:hypothetical protein JCM10908_002790 [Rhodotorula pacifica]|uniref:cleavage polyadenylation factor subunit RNA14 n=1 Tax=Rhodotorula pacifica TaxID=1495444 RepID=UPI00316EC784
MSDAVSVDPRRARMQAAAQPTQPAETTAAPAEVTEMATEATPAPPAPTEAAAVEVPLDPTHDPSHGNLDTSATTAPPETASTDTSTPVTQEPTGAASGSVVAPTPARQDSDLDAAIAATLAMDSEQGLQSEEVLSLEQQSAESQIAPEAAGANADAERTPREATGTPSLYSAAASAGDVPGAVATPPLATAVNGHDAQDATMDAQSSVAAAPPASGRNAGAATSSLSRVAQLTARIEKDPLDGQAQLALLHDAESKGDLERTREVYERFLSVFPDAAEQWISYCNLELAHNLFDRVEALFGRCCRTSTSVDLWRFYLDYIRRVNPIDSANLEAAKAARSVIGAAFDFAITHVGHDRRAGEIWSEYLTFLREAPTKGTWEEQQKMDQLRKAYQRAIQAPINNVESIWQEYNAFENNLGKLTAKKFIAEHSPAYMTARKTLRELRAQHDHLYSPVLPHRPDWSSTEHVAGLERWKAYLDYEEKNPLEIEDPAQLYQRVSFAYRKAVANLRFFPEIWYLAASASLRAGRNEEALKQLQEGLNANPGSLLLAFTLADLEEGKPDLPACYAIYDSLLAHLTARIASLEADVEAEIAAAVADREEQQRAQLRAQAEAGGVGEEDETVEMREKRAQELEAVRDEIKERRTPEIEVIKRAVANVWIAEMRFARRSDGLRQARQVFLKAKKTPNLAWQVVEASATMEMYWNSEPKVATNVFELGLKMFGSEPDYILRYLEFLLQQNNANNARALFERSVAVIEPVKAKPIWDRMAQYEFQYGDHLAAQKMAKRYAETYPEIGATVLFAQRHQHAGLEDSYSLDLGPSFVRHIKRGRQSRSASPTPRQKRELSAEGDADGDAKRQRRTSASPGPSSGWRGPADQHRPNAPQAAPALNRPQPYMLDPQGHDVAVLPDAVVFFLSLLPSAQAFNGPHLNPASIMDIIGTTLLPGSAPGPGLPGERLGIPPRPKPQRPQYGVPSGFGGGGPQGGRRY